MATTWCTKADVKRLITSLDDILTSGELTDQDLTDIREKATGKAMAYLRNSSGDEFHRWGQEPPQEIRGAVAVLAACGVAKGCPAGLAYDVYCGEPVSEAIAFLRDLAKGVAAVDVPEPPIEERQKAQVSTSGLKPVFGPRGPLKGW